MTTRWLNREYRFLPVFDQARCLLWPRVLRERSEHDEATFATCRR